MTPVWVGTLDVGVAFSSEPNKDHDFNNLHHMDELIILLISESLKNTA